MQLVVLPVLAVHHFQPVVQTQRFRVSAQLVLLGRLRVPLHAVVYLPLYGGCRAFQLRTLQSLLLRVRAVLGGYRPPGHRPLYAVLQVGFLLLSATLTLMRMRNLILLMEKRRPWVSELILKRGRK